MKDRILAAAVALLLALSAATSLFAAVPSYSDFDTNSFKITGRSIALASAVIGTNSVVTNYVLYGSNYYAGDTYIQTNLQADTYVSNYFATYTYQTNVLQTNVTVQEYISQNSYVSNYVSEFISTNNYFNDYFTTNVFPTTTTYVTNRVEGDYIGNLNGFGTNTALYGTTKFGGVAPNRLLYLDPNNFLASLSTAAGVLTNHGNGTMQWVPVVTLIENIVITNISITNITAKVLNIQNIYSGSGVFTNGITNLALTASTVLQADANKSIMSIPNGTGALTNDGAGVVGWTPLPPGQTNIGWAGVTNLQTAQVPSSVLTNDLADSQLSANVPLKDAANDFAASNSFASTLAAKSFKTLTNSWAGPTNSLDLLASWVKYATYTPCAVTGLLNKSASGKVVDSTLLTVTNAASTNITLYWTSAVRMGDGARSWVITNATEGKLSVEYDPNNSTNAVFRLFY